MNSKLHEDILRVCKNAENSSVELDESNKIYTLKSKKDLSNEIASVILQHKMPIKTFYTKEPKLEDAIIKLSKGA